MKTQQGDKIININLPTTDGSLFKTATLEGKPFMLSFFRFASCPFCNMRLHQLVTHFDQFGDDFTIVAIFDSPLDNLIHHSKSHQAPFPILADEENIYYKKYSIERSLAGVITGMITRLPTLLKGMFKGYLPLVIKGSMTTMPADFLVDRNGIIQSAYYGKDEGDHLPLQQILEFSKNQN